MVQQSVQHGCRDGGVAEDGAPRLEGAVAGDDQRAVFVGLGDHLEEMVGGSDIHGQETELVQDNEVVVGQAAKAGLEGPVSQGGIERVDGILHSGEEHSVTCCHRLEPQRLG